MEDKLVISQQATFEPSDSELVELASKIEAIINEGRQKLAVSIVRVTKETYWNIGRHIVEFEQGGNARAKYGSELLTMLARILRIRVGRGYSRPNLYNMRKFYLTYPDYQVSSEDSAPIFQTSGKSDTPIIQTSDKLTWSHICELITIDDPMERSFYEKECVANSWSAVTLHRQKESGLFMRLAISRDKEGVLQLATQGQQVQTPSDVVKDHYTLEFLGLADKARYKESDLEARLIDNMQMFLLELGKGFTFVKRQYALTISNVHYHIDLVFYHRILRCFVLIDLKRGAVQHKDIGQMNMYMGYFAKEENVEGDNPPIGIILGHYKDDLMVEYATYGMDANLFVSKYELYLPNKEELRNMVRQIMQR